MNKTSYNKTVIIYLIGLAGSGKYTISQNISVHNYKVVDNHLINNPILALLDLDGVTPIPKIAWDAISHIRSTVFGFIQHDYTTNYVFTNELLESPVDHDIYNQVLNISALRNSIFVPVKLIISPEELARRIVFPERKKQLKTTNIDEAYTNKKSIKITHNNLLELDITNLKADGAAEKILFHVDHLKNIMSQ